MAELEREIAKAKEMQGSSDDKKVKQLNQELERAKKQVQDLRKELNE